MTEEFDNASYDVDEEITPALDTDELPDKADVATDVEEAADEPLTDVAETAQSLEQLKEELANLKALLSEKEAKQEKILRELGEFNRLFPEISVKSVPDSVWKSVEGGVPLSAAYALYEQEERLRKYHADEVNRRNASLSAGRAGKNTRGEYFSPDEVRAMTAREVHENYSKIKESMKFWL